MIINNIRNFVKRNPKGLGCFFIAVSLILFIFNYENSKLCINDLTDDNIQYYAEEIDGLGIDTLENIVANKPYTNMAQILKVEGVGTVKYRILLKHFGKNEPCRRGAFLFSVFLMIFFNVLGTCLIKCENERRRTDAKILIDSWVLKPELKEDKPKEDKPKYKLKDEK